MNPLPIILGPTASGKTHLATRIASRINGAILSADSRQVYKGMNIGTGKDLDEYVVDGQPVPYHLIDILDAGEKYNISLFKHDFQEAYQQVVNQNQTPIACGGTGFYLYALLNSQGYTEIPVDENLREILEDKTYEALRTIFTELESSYLDRADTSTRKRLIRAIEISTFLIQNPEIEKQIEDTASFEYNPVIFGLNPAAEIRRERISQRLSYRLEHGLIQEVEALLASGLSAEQLIYYGLEYKYITEYLTGALTYDQMSKKLETEIHRFAKRQMTFFRKMEKDGMKIHWLDQSKTEEENISFVISELEKFKQNQ
ncbi:tRNA (adenosine(37)-N6)-dimethylallyltransferase MiaA [Dyadobacter sp. LHD-138]|uniref:tRNA (adenosine(37)-N6)-dimethylallyltransferase MiaA n=1 Tax=Dyadobacter sp. LHD-138 TaxID=3071413 RepID=UPI0027E0496C|nr:tRNA (adenosine(37)-N6)-dimethylallyltransferase MiaA [Dyadobacter sp. LHD-138]MDQ6482481.1 tRNA (adenosine(37)-N6)-dimethylallyltransferase MiaA [Dyadobacter sp. LHD-138]